MKRVRVNRTCCFPFASKKSSRMNGIISPRGNCEESLIEIHYSSYILVGSVDTRQKGKKKEDSQGPRLDVADKLSSLRH